MVIAVISYLFFFLRRKGTGISFLQSALISAAAAALLALSAAGGIYALVMGIEAPVIEEIEENGEDRENTATPFHEKNIEQSGKAVTEQKKPLPENQQASDVNIQTITFQVLKADKKLSTEAAVLTGKIIGILKKQNRNLRLIPAGSKEGGASGTILIGSLESDGKSYSVTTKLVDLKSGKVLFMDHQSIPINENPDKSAETMAKSISGMLAELNRKDQRN
jgi:hypothetical protein